MPAKLKSVLRAVGSFQAGVVLGFLYYAGVGATFLLSRLAGRDGLGLKDAGTGWTERAPVEPAAHLAEQG